MRTSVGWVAELAPFLALATVLAILAAGCGSGGGSGSGTGGSTGGSTPIDPGVPPPPGFASTVTMVVVSADPLAPLSVLSVNEATGELGLLPGSPGPIGGPAGTNTMTIADVPRRRVFVALDQANAIAVVTIDQEGQPVLAPGAPFPAERSEPCSLALGQGGSFLYVGHAGSSAVSQLRVDPTSGTLTAIAAPVNLGAANVKTLSATGDLLYVPVYDSQSVRAFRINTLTGQLTAIAPATVTLSSRPIDSEVSGDRLYVSLCSCDGGQGAIDAFNIDRPTGALTRVAGAPFKFPGIDNYQRIAIRPDGRFLVAGVHVPPSVVRFEINGDGSLTARDHIPVHGGTSGPHGVSWTPDGHYVYLADQNVSRDEQGIYVFELFGDRTLRPGAPFRYRLAAGSGQVDLGAFSISVSPATGSP